MLLPVNILITFEPCLEHTEETRHTVDLAMILINHGLQFVRSVLFYRSLLNAFQIGHPCSANIFIWPQVQAA